MRVTKASPLLPALALLSATAFGAETPSPAPALAPGAGVELVQSRCTVCHPATMITSQHRSRQQWSDLVDQMINKGAQVSDDDYKLIIDYLARTYPAAR